jgi:hypothetical protein
LSSTLARSVEAVSGSQFRLTSTGYFLFYSQEPVEAFKL